MLIRFTLENFLSIREEQELSLVASAIKDAGASLVPIPNTELSLLPAVVLYGANASGKSNFIAGLQFFSRVVRFSHERGEPGSRIPRTPFLLDEKLRKVPTRCNIEFLLEGVRYEYGFTSDDESYLEEWLYTFPSAKRQTLFVREPHKKKIYFGKNLKGNSRTVETLMRPNSLFLSVAAQNAHEQLTPIYSYLTNFSFAFGVTNSPSDAFRAFRDGNFDRRIMELLKHADTGISDYRFEELTSSDSAENFETELAALLKKHVPDFNLSAI